MKKLLKKYYQEILAIFIPIIILSISSLIAKLYPFGKQTMALYDAYYQYPGFFLYLKEILLGNKSILYSFNGLLGVNFYATSAYYLFNPSNLLLILFKNTNILNFFTFLIYFRIALSSFTMLKYLKYKFKNKKHNFYIILFSIAYSLMGYNVSYFYNFMYFDAVVLLPLIMIGLEKILEDKKSTLYVITLTIAIISNFYIGYMICIFSLIYFIYNYYLLETKNKRIIKKFIISSLLAGLMTAFVLLPTIYELLQGKAIHFSNDYQTDYLGFNFNFLNFFYKMTPGSIIKYDIQYGSVNVYCSLLILTLVITFFFNKKIKKKEKIATLILTLFFLLSISFNLIDYAWHMFQKPIWYPNRYIFTFSFFLITIAYKEFLERGNINISFKFKMLIFGIFILLIIYPIIEAQAFTSTIKIICLLFSILLILQYLMQNNYKIIAALFIIELLLNTSITFQVLRMGNSHEAIIFKQNVYNELIRKIKENENDNNVFYRVHLDAIDDYNEGFTNDYYAINYFSSIKNGKTINFFDKNFNYAVDSQTSVKYNLFNPYMNAFLGIKYFNASSDEKYYKQIYDEGNYLYFNEDALPLIFESNSKIKNVKLIENKKAYLENTKLIINSILDKKSNIYYKLNNYNLENASVELTENNEMIRKIGNSDKTIVTYKNTANEDGFLILNDQIKYYSKVKIIIDGIDESDYINKNKTALFIKKGQTYEISFSSALYEYQKEYTEIYFIPYNEYKYFVNNINKSFKIIEKNKDNYFKSSVIAENEDSYFMTTIPYDSGWQIKLNNQKINYDICLDTFICFKTKKGENILEFNYMPVGLKLGIFISALTFIITLIYLRKQK